MKAKCMLCLFSLLVLLMATAVPSIAQNEVAALTITSIDGGAETFPEIHVNFRVETGDGNIVRDLTESDVILAEGNTPFSLTSGPTVQNDAGLWVRFVISGGIRMRNANNDDNALDSIRTFVSSARFFQENDKVAVTVLEGQGFSNRVNFTSDANTIRAALTNITPCSEMMCTRPFASVESLLTDDIWVDAQRQPQIIIYLTPSIDDLQGSSVASLGSLASSNGVAIYTVVFGEEVSANRLADLALASSGWAVTFNDLNDLYGDIVARHRAYYTASYRTTNSEPGTRTVVATYTNEDNRVSDAATYMVEEMQGPSIVIDNPTEDANLSPESADAMINGRVRFTNYGQRALSLIQLSVNGRLVDSIEKPEEMDFTFPFPWEEIQENGRLELAITATDELGLSRDESVSVDVILQAIEMPEESTGTSEVQPVANNTAEANIDEATAVPETLFSSNTAILIGMIALASVMIVLVITNQKKAPVQNMRNTIMRGMDRLTKRYQRQTEVKGYLIVLQGDTSMGKSLEIYGTTPIGRSKEDAELLFQQHDENSPISRRHCTILDEEDHFKLRDEDSANGTYLNGVRLPPMEPRELFDGDEIELARVERGGVKIRFQGVQPQQEDLTDSEFKMTRIEARPNRQPNFGEQTGDRF